MSAPLIEPFAGLSHAEVLDLRFEDESADLIDGLIPRGVLAVVAGLPETFKGWVCAQASLVVASGSGTVFGREATAQGPVGYFWQDDSTRHEAERVQLFAEERRTPRDLPVRWFLNDGVELPRDIERVRATVEAHGFVMVVLDSVYNFTPGLDLKDRDVGQLFVQIKAEVCDPTGCTVVVVDHMPWATAENRKRLRSYGDVFKGAAARAGIYIDVDDSKLYVEARGNNVRGFERTRAYWDADALELRLAPTAREDETDEDLLGRVIAFVTEYPGASSNEVEHGVDGTRSAIRGAIERLSTPGESQRLAAGPGKHPKGHYWYPLNHAALRFAGESAATLGDMSPGLNQDGDSPERVVAPVGANLGGDSQDSGDPDGRDEAQPLAVEPSANGRPLIGEEGFEEALFAALGKGLITEGEFTQAARAHRLVATRGST